MENSIFYYALVPIQHVKQALVVTGKIVQGMTRVSTFLQDATGMENEDCHHYRAVIRRIPRVNHAADNCYDVKSKC